MFASASLANLASRLALIASSTFCISTSFFESLSAKTKNIELL